MTARVVVLDVDELRELVREAVREALEERADARPDWLDTAAVASMLGVSGRCVTKLANAGELRGTRVGVGGKLWRFRRADVEAYLAKGRGG